MSELSKTSHLVKSQLPHYFVATRGLDWSRCCGTLRDVDTILSIYPDAVITQVFPRQPEVVDVPFVRVAPDLELPMQQVLPESDWVELNTEDML